MRGLWLIDGSYIYKASKAFQRENPAYDKKGVDYTKLKKELCTAFDISSLDSWYFNSTPDPASDEQNAYHRWLKTAEPDGPHIRVKLYSLKEKKYHCRDCNKDFSIRVQKGVDVGIATAALRLYERYDVIILSAGDGDFEDFIRFLVEDKDKKLYIAGFARTISPDIQQFSNSIYLLNEHYSDICDARDLKPFDAIDDLTEENSDDE